VKLKKKRKNETLSNKTLGSAEYPKSKEVCRTIPVHYVAHDVRHGLFNDDMKTRKQVTEEIERLMSIGLSTSDEKEKNRIRKRICFLRSIEMYLEHSPTTETVVFQLDLCLKKIDVIHKEFDQMYPSYCDANTKREFMKGKGLPELTKQVKVLQYLLESK